MMINLLGLVWNILILDVGLNTILFLKKVSNMNFTFTDLVHM